jgi:hypothetical protein
MKILAALTVFDIINNSQGATDCGNDNPFATKTLQEKYVEMKSNEVLQYEKFCPYQTNLENVLSVVHQWPNCPNGFAGYNAGDPDCMDRNHMYNWMVWRLTGLKPSQYYRCILKNLNLFDTEYESKAPEIKDDNGQSFDFSKEHFQESSDKCTSAEKGGMVIFAADRKTDSAYTNLINRWSAADKDDLADIFGVTLIHYCYYTPGLSYTKVCKERCNALEAGGYFAKSHEAKMFCRNIASSELTAIDLISRPSVNAFNDYLENQYTFRGINLNVDEESSARITTLSPILLFTLLFISIFVW